jgi:hypothetical protein
VLVPVIVLVLVFLGKEAKKPSSTDTDRLASARFEKYTCRKPWLFRDEAYMTESPMVAAGAGIRDMRPAAMVQSLSDPSKIRSPGAASDGDDEDEEEGEVGGGAHEEDLLLGARACGGGVPNAPW